VGKVKRFAEWGRRLDERALGPAGWLPHDTTYSEYQKALAVGSASPAWVRVARVVLVVVLLALQLWGGESTWSLILLVPLVAAIGVLSFRVDRDIRIAARNRSR